LCPKSEMAISLAERLHRRVTANPIIIMKKRVYISVRGAVQGVGFRPFVYGLAARMGLAGFVLNGPEGVRIELEGTETLIADFLRELENSPPPLARIEEILVENIETIGAESFEVRESGDAGDRTVLIPPDLATCGDCLREMNDPDDRRHRYPFINCTNCGPRYTIIQDLPYDRARTTMAPFRMCLECSKEYGLPSNRRFHAEPTCCPDCGPAIWLEDTAGNKLNYPDPVSGAISRLKAGEVVAIKGLGGFHLACDAANTEAVQRLRKRKDRDLKPFAVMARDLDAATLLCSFKSDTEADCLTSRERPIILLDKREGHGLAEEIAPRNPCFGVMLPYTPLHHLLMEGPFKALVMTSGNVASEPIAHTNEEAREQLSELADCFLMHDRGIHIRTDDSVAKVIAGKLRFLRRSRGYAPFPVKLPFDTAGRETLAVGPELNNTICITRGEYAFISHHVGDLANLSAYESFLQAIDHLCDILQVKPRLMSYDPHPGYLSTKFAMGENSARDETFKDMPRKRDAVQHHHAHAVSAMVEAGHLGPALAVVYDGLGWGDDETLWGGEFLIMHDYGTHTRAGHFQPVEQPGGDKAAKETRRMAYAFLRAIYGGKARKKCAELMPEFADQAAILEQMIAAGLNCPVTTSMGRLFDAASALLGVCEYNSYHAQAPIELEALAYEAPGEKQYYETWIEPSMADPFVVQSCDIIRSLINDQKKGTPKPRLAARFHNSIAHATLHACEIMRGQTNLDDVVLSGGVFASSFLTERLVSLLKDNGFNPILNADVPPGDGGVSLGQAAATAWRYLNNVSGDTRTD